MLLYEAVEITKKIMIKKRINSNYLNYSTVEPRFNTALFIKVLDIRNQSYSKTYGIEPRYIIWRPKCKINLDITNYTVNMREKIDAEQINSQQMLKS